MKSIKYVLIVVAIILLILSIIFFTNKKKEITGNITLVYDSSENDTYIFNKFIFDMYTNKSNVDGNVFIIEEDNYLSFIINSLKNGDKKDIFYTTYSSLVYKTLLKEDNIQRFNNASFKTFTLNNNSTFYFPITWSPWGMYYNVELFSELNLTEPKTIEELNNICEILIKNKIVPYSMIQNIQWPLTPWFDYLDLRMNGVKFHNQLLDGLISFTDSRVEAVYLEIYNMIKKGYFYIDPLAYEWTTMLETVENKSTAMVLGGAYLYDNASESLKENLGWFQFPLQNIKDSYSEIVTTSGYIVNKRSESIDAVKDFINFSLSEGAQRAIRDYSNLYPINKSILESLKRDDLNKAYSKAINATELIPQFERNNNSKIHLYFKSSLNLLFSIENEDDIKVILENLEIIRNKN